MCVMRSRGETLDVEPLRFDADLLNDGGDVDGEVDVLAIAEAHDGREVCGGEFPISQRVVYVRKPSLSTMMVRRKDIPRLPPGYVAQPNRAYCVLLVALEDAVGVKLH